MKVSINQVKINRVGINTAQVRGIRLSSADRGHKVDFPFSDSLIDYWNFKGKNNSDEDRDTIKGIKGGILTAYNFGWSLGSGYGLYKENYNNFRQLSGTTGVFTNTDHSIHISNVNAVNIPVTEIPYKAGEISPEYQIKVTGLLEGQYCDIGYFYNYADNIKPSVQENLIHILKDGIYTMPSFTFPSDIKAGTSTRIVFNFAGDTDITIEQIPLYEGAIVTDGVDDYLKLDKVGYKVRTIIIKFKTINIKPNIVNSILNIHTDEVVLQYDTSGVLNNNFTTYKNYGEYSVGTFNIDKNAATPLTLGCKLSNSGRPMEYSNVAIYSVAIYQNVLTAEEIQKEINVMEYDTPNPVFALNFDNFAYKAVDYPDFATGKVTTNKIVVDSTTETFNGAIAVAMNPEADTGEPIEVPSYKIKVTGLNQYSVGEGNWAVGLMGMMIDSTKDPWTYLISKDGVYDIPAISLSDGIYNLGIMAQIAIDKPIEIEVLYDKNVTKSFPENKQIFP